ncbi:MAG: energy-coupling factor transporter transmembrane protein EcfT [Clostridia bacterium]|nr:energy-coupling factor transporter transmembrane protein EcfT [Clostridia bacterium]
MKKTDAFSSCHPIVNITYFGLVIAFSMLFMHPVCLIISLFCAFIYAIYLRGSRAIRLMLLYMLPLMLFTAALNPLFNHEGATTLSYFASGNPLTLESITYGAAAAAMLVSVICWFSCVNAVMTSDKLVYLFGRIVPALSLVLSMTLRFAPRFAAQFKEVIAARSCLGYGGKNTGLLQRAKNGLAVLSVMVTWSMESAIDTSDSMRSRGYGLCGRTAFSIYRFDRHDLTVLLWLIFAGACVAVGGMLKAMYWRYFPTMRGADPGFFSVSIFAAYFALFITPVAVDVREDRKWKSLQSKI